MKIATPSNIFKIIVISLLFLVPVLVMATNAIKEHNKNKEYREISDGIVEVWEKTKTIDVKEREKQIQNMEKLKKDLETTTFFIDECIENCRNVCETDYSLEIELGYNPSEDFLTECQSHCDDECEESNEMEIVYIEYYIDSLQAELNEVTE